MILPDGSTQNCPACAIYHTHRKSNYSMDATVAAIETHLAWVCMGEILACCSMPGNMIRMQHLTCTVPYWVGGSRCLASHSSNKALKVWKCDATILILGTTHTMFFVFLGFCLGASACQTWSFLSGQHAEMLSQSGLLPPSPSPNKRTSALMGSLNFVFSKLQSSDLTNVPSDIFLHSCSSRWPEASVSNRRKASHVSVSDFVMLNTASKMPDLNLDRAFAANSD